MRSRSPSATARAACWPSSESWWRKAISRCVVRCDLNAQPALPGEFKALLQDLAAHWAQVRARIDACDARIESHAREDESGVRLRAIIGIGPIAADAVVATVGNAREFKHGRQKATWLGLVPTQHSSGGNTRLATISCRGDAYLRTLLIQGARSSLQRAKAVATEKATPERETGTSTIPTSIYVTCQRFPTDALRSSCHAFHMTTARSLSVDSESPGYYHCMSRCVRRAWLCGIDPYDGQSYEYRRE